MPCGTSLDLISSLGITPHESPIGDRIVQLSDYACDQLEQHGAIVLSPRVNGHKSGIIVFEVPGIEPAAFRDRCLQQGVVVSCRGGGVRISPHAYNDELEIDKLTQIVSDMVA